MAPQHVASWTASGSPLVYVMRYEDMLEDARAAFTGLVRFMRIDTDKKAIARAVAQSSFERVQAIEAEHGFVEKTPAQERFFRAGRPGQWKEALTPKQVRAIVEAHCGQMARFGYVPEGF